MSDKEINDKLIALRREFASRVDMLERRIQRDEDAIRTKSNNTADAFDTFKGNAQAAIAAINNRLGAAEAQIASLRARLAELELPPP